MADIDRLRRLAELGDIDAATEYHRAMRRQGSSGLNLLSSVALGLMIERKITTEEALSYHIDPVDEELNRLLHLAESTLDRTADSIRGVNNRSLRSEIAESPTHVTYRVSSDRAIYFPYHSGLEFYIDHRYARYDEDGVSTAFHIDIDLSVSDVLPPTPLRILREEIPHADADKFRTMGVSVLASSIFEGPTRGCCDIFSGNGIETRFSVWSQPNLPEPRYVCSINEVIGFVDWWWIPRTRRRQYDPETAVDIVRRALEVVPEIAERVLPAVVDELRRIHGRRRPYQSH